MTMSFITLCTVASSAERQIRNILIIIELTIAKGIFEYFQLLPDASCINHSQNVRFFNR